MVKSLLIFHLLLGSYASGQETNFFKEDITFRLGGKYFVVNGYYWFSNPSDNERRNVIFYPLNEETGPVDSVEVSEVAGRGHVKILDRTKAGFMFVLNLPPADTAVYHVVYRQEIIADSAMYILRSTRAWNRPLESAEYKLITDGSIAVTRFSYQPDKVYTIEGQRIYYWKRADFMPDQDMVFHFRHN